MRHSVSWWCFAKQLSSGELIAAAADIGYAGFDLVPDEHWSAIHDAGLEIAAVGGHRSLQDGLNKRSNHDRIEGEILENLKRAEDHGIHALICFSGDRHDGNDDEAGIEATAAGLRRVAGAAEQAGVDLVLELLNSKVDHVDYQCDSTLWGVEVIKRVASPRVKLLYDIYHMQIMEGDLIRTIRQHHEHFAHYHTAGNPGRHELDENQEIYYPAVMRVIEETGFDGFVGHEFVPQGDPVASLRQAFEVCGI
jgi:hydroxypyruvate isomerase